MNHIAPTAQTVIDQHLVIVIRGVDRSQLSSVVDALYTGGVRVAEIAFNPKDPSSFKTTADNIAFLREKTDKKMLIGAGTCVTEEIFCYARDAGAQLIVSPDFNPAIVTLSKENGLISMPGAFTPSECTAAYRTGADIIKLFPYTASDLGVIQNITTPLNYIPFFAFGGANENNVGDFLKNGVVGIGTGISILKKDLLRNSNYTEIERLTRLHTDAIRKAVDEMET